MLMTRWIASLHQAHVIFWDDHLYVGLQRSRTVYLSPNTLLLDLAALSFYGWSKHSKTMAFIWSKCHSTATMKAPWKLPKPSLALEDKAHSDPSSLSQRSCHEGRYWYHSRQHWRATGRYLHKALGWEKVLQVAVCAKYPGILKCPVNGTHILTLMLTWWLRCATHEVTFFFNQWRLTLYVWRN